VSKNPKPPNQAKENLMSQFAQSQEKLNDTHYYSTSNSDQIAEWINNNRLNWEIAERNGFYDRFNTAWARELRLVNGQFR